MDSEHDEQGDRRRAARIPINAEFAAMAEATYISDLSEYGVFVHTPRPAPRGTKLKLRFTVLLDDPVIVEGEGRVVRQQYEPVSGMGIEFSELSPEMILRINDVVSRQRPRDLGAPLRRDEDLESDPLDTAQTLKRGSGPGAVFGSAKAVFRPPALPGGTHEHAKTGSYVPASVDIEDVDSEH